MLNTERTEKSSVLPKVLLFDIGDVVVDSSHMITHKLLEDLGVTKQRAKLFFANNDYIEFSRGNISGQNFYKALVDEHLGTSLTYEQVVNAHNQHIYGLDRGVVRIIQKLSKYMVSFATNTNEWQTAREKEFVDLSMYSKHIFRSHELHKVKKDEGFFEQVLRSLDVEPAETLFIDDNPQNVNIARVLGLQALVFASSTQLQESLKELGVWQS